MEQIEKNTLIALKSIFELNQGFSGVDFLLSKITNNSLRLKISQEFSRNNFGNAVTFIDKYLYEQIENPPVFDISDIVSFDFDSIYDETIEFIKTKLKIQELKFNYIKRPDGSNSNLGLHWDNEKRFSVVIDDNLFNSIKENPKIKLDVYKEIIYAKLGYYTKFVIEESTNEEFDNGNSYEGFEDSTDWTNFNEDLDFDQQSEEFWNQF